MVKTTCNFCDKEIDIFLYQTKYHEKHFCNRTCYANWQRKNKPDWKRIETNCNFCNKKIDVKLSKFKKFKHYFCSRECTANWNKKNAPRGKNSPHWKGKIILNCAFCDKEFAIHKAWIRKNKTHFCSKNCFFKWKRENTPKGKDNHRWNGGRFPHYGDCWYVQKGRIIERANHVSEMSGNNGGKMGVHHIIPVKNFIRKFIELGLKDIPSVEIYSFKVLPYNLIPSLIFAEANAEGNLMYLTQSEHITFEGMPPTFFDEIRRMNAEER